MKLAWNKSIYVAMNRQGEQNNVLGLQACGEKVKEAGKFKTCHVSGLPLILACYANKKIFCYIVTKSIQEALEKVKHTVDVEQKLCFVAFNYSSDII